MEKIPTKFNLKLVINLLRGIWEIFRQKFQIFALFFSIERMFAGINIRLNFIHNSSIINQYFLNNLLNTIFRCFFYAVQAPLKYFEKHFPLFLPMKMMIVNSFSTSGDYSSIFCLSLHKLWIMLTYYRDSAEYKTCEGINCRCRERKIAAK